LLDADQAKTLDERLGLLFRETGIDARIGVVDGGGTSDLDAHAAEQFQALGVGSHLAEGRGLLLVYDLAAERLRIEVGYGLEEYFPDAFVGYLIHDNARYLFDAGDPQFALLLTIRMLEHRIRMASLGGRFDPTFVRALRAARYGSGGAGASDRAPRARGETESFAREMSSAWRAGFSAAPSVEESYQRYVEWLAVGIFDPQISIFTPETRRFLANWPMTGGYFDYILVREYGNQVEIVEQGDRALLYSTNRPFNTPIFFRLVDEGWQLDLVAGVDEIRSVAGGPYSWSFRRPEGLYTRLFADELVAVNGMLRVRGGDNRPAKTFQ
jgi:uncharacterized protein